MPARNTETRIVSVVGYTRKAVKFQTTITRRTKTQLLAFEKYNKRFMLLCTWVHLLVQKKGYNEKILPNLFCKRTLSLAISGIGCGQQGQDAAARISLAHYK